MLLTPHLVLEDGLMRGSKSLERRWKQVNSRLGIDVRPL
jgi:hypothetical protein